MASPSADTLRFLSEQKFTMKEPFSLRLARYHVSPPGIRFCRQCTRDLPISAFWVGAVTGAAERSGSKSFAA